MQGVNNWLLGCLRCYIQGSSHNNVMINSWDCMATGVSGMVAINSRNFSGDSRHNGWTVINGGRVLKNGWTTLNSSNASALSPYTLSGNAGNKYKVDTSLGDVYVVCDLTALNGSHFWLKVIDATNNIVITTTSGSGEFEFNAVPYTITGLVQGDSFTISSDGTDLFII